jgi:ribosomal protein S12 methylthiotransferase accessory factor
MGLSEPLGESAVALAAAALRQLLANGIPSGHLWRLEWRTMIAAHHKVARLPYCPVCGGKMFNPALRRLVLPLPETPLSDLSSRLDAAADPVTGVLWSLERQTPQFAALVPCFRAQISQPLVENVGAPATGGGGAVAGKAWTESDARAGCIAEAVERYSLFWRSDVEVRCARYGELGGEALHPRELLAFSDAQHAGREQWNRAGRFPPIPPRFDEGVAIDWLAGTSLVTGKRKWMPAGYCLAGYRHDGMQDFWQGAGNGCAAGISVAAAASSALLELAERDAVAIWWYNRLRRPAVDLRAFHDTGMRAVEEQLRAHGRTLHLLDLTTDLPLPVFAAISTTTAGREIVLGFASDLDAKAAARKAVAELVQLLDAPQVLPEMAHAPDLGFRSWLLEHTLDSAPYCRPSRTVRRVPRSIETEASSTARLAACVSAFVATGLEPSVVDLTRAETGIPVVLAACPGLRHWWHRLGPGRLYTVPVRMGWLRSARSELAMNPIPFFL